MHFSRLLDVKDFSGKKFSAWAGVLMHGGWERAVAGLFVFFLSMPMLTAQTGSLEGTVFIPQKSGGSRVAIEKYSGKISGKVSPPPPVLAGVWLSRADLKAPASPPDLQLGQEGYQFAQSLLIVPVGTRVFFPNQDPDYHNIYSLSRNNRFDIGRYLKDEKPTPSRVFKNPGIVRLNCEIHDHMRAYVVVVDSPYYARTDRGGNFKLTGIPAGSYTLHVQIGQKNGWEVDVQIAPGEKKKLELGKDNG